MEILLAALAFALFSMAVAIRSRADIDMLLLTGAAFAFLAAAYRLNPGLPVELQVVAVVMALGVVATFVDVIMRMRR